MGSLFIVLFFSILAGAAIEAIIKKIMGIPLFAEDEQ